MFLKILTVISVVLGCLILSSRLHALGKSGHENEPLISESKTKPEFDPSTVPDFAQLMKLSPVQRSKYLHDLAEIIADLSLKNENGSGLFAQSQIESDKSKIESVLNFLLPRVCAAEPDGSTQSLETQSDAASQDVMSAGKKLVVPCVRPQRSCSSENIRKMATEFRHSGAHTACIYAGNISEMKPGGVYCAPVSNFCLGSMNCKRPGDATASLNPDYSCRGNPDGRHFISDYGSLE